MSDIPVQREEIMILTFLRGIRDPYSYTKRRLNENPEATFQEAVAMAKRLEKIDEMLATSVRR